RAAVDPDGVDRPASAAVVVGGLGLRGPSSAVAQALAARLRAAARFPRRRAFAPGDEPRLHDDPRGRAVARVQLLGAERARLPSDDGARVAPLSRADRPAGG